MPGPDKDRSHEVQGRAQVKRAQQKKRNEEMAQDVDAMRHSYARIKDEPAFRDILAKAKSFAAYHTKMAKDGVGYRDTGEFDERNQPKQEIVYYTNEKRVSELDKAAGIEELEDYIQRQLGAAKPEKTEAAPVAGEPVTDTEADSEDESSTDESAPVA